jgi:hypothetical protein
MQHASLSAIHDANPFVSEETADLRRIFCHPAQTEEGTSSPLEICMDSLRTPEAKRAFML